MKAHFNFSISVRLVWRIFALTLSVWGGTCDTYADQNSEPDYAKLIVGVEKTIQARQYKIRFLKFKQELHQRCLCSSTYGSHKRSASGVFDGKQYKVCHQHPAGEKHNSGVTQAITALQRKIDAMERSVELQEQKKAELIKKAAAAEEACAASEEAS